MSKNRWVLVICLSFLLAGLATIVLAPVVVANGLRVWLRWQAQRQQLQIETGKIQAPFLRPVTIDTVRVTNKAGALPHIELRAERVVLQPRLAGLLAGRGDAIRALSIETSRVEIRRDFEKATGHERFNWAALQALLPTNFNLARLDLRIENGPTVIVMRNAAISANQIQSGRATADELAITSPWFRQTFSQLRGATKWQENRLSVGGINLSSGLDLQSFTIDLSHLGSERTDLQFDLDAFGGKIRASISNEWRAQHSNWNIAATANGISLAQTSEALGFTDRLGGAVRACNFTFRGDPRDPMHATASIWAELNGLSWHNRAADLIMLGAIFYNRQIQLQQLYIKQQRNQLTMSGEGAVPSKSTDWLNPDFKGDISGAISDLGQFAGLFGAEPGDFAGTIAIEGTINARERKIGGHLTATAKSLSIFKRQVDQLSAKLNLKESDLEIEQLEVTRKKDFLRAQGKIDMAHEHDYSGTIEANIGDATEYFLLGRAATAAAPIPVQFNASVSSSSWDTHGGFTLPGSNPVTIAAKFPLKVSQDWKIFLASPLEATIDFPTVVLASAPQLLHPAVFNEGILSGRISLSQNLQHPRVTGDMQLLNAKLQNSPFDFTQASGRLTFAGDHATLEFLDATTQDVDVSVRGDVDFRDMAEVKIDIFPSVPVFELANPPSICVSRINLRPVGIILAPMIDQIEFRGGLFEGNWTMNLRQAAIAAPAQAIQSASTKIPLCFGDNPSPQVFTLGLHPRSTPEAPKPRKRGKRR
jgi:hypothetical protein